MGSKKGVAIAVLTTTGIIATINAASPQQAVKATTVLKIAENGCLSMCFSPFFEPREVLELPKEHLSIVKSKKFLTACSAQQV
jgi:hypothetical protein